MSGVHVRVRVCQERYALPIENILEVANQGALTTVPGARAAVLGVRNLKGHVLPVFDVARVLTVPGDPSTDRVLVAEHDGRLAGLAVEEVTDVGPLATGGAETESEYLTGAVLEDGRLVGIIDVGRLFRSLAALAS